MRMTEYSYEDRVLDAYDGKLSNSKHLAGDWFSVADFQHLPFSAILINHNFS